MCRGFRVIYIDESMVTKSTIATHEYSVKNENYSIDLKQYGKETIAVIAGISRENGIDHVLTFNASVNIPKFKVFL